MFKYECTKTRTRSATKWMENEEMLEAWVVTACPQGGVTSEAELCQRRIQITYNYLQHLPFQLQESLGGRGYCKACSMLMWPTSTVTLPHDLVDQRPYCNVNVATLLKFHYDTEESAQASLSVFFPLAWKRLIYFIAPGELIKLLIDYYAMGINDVEITKLLKSHYDTTIYGLRWVFFTIINICLTAKIIVFILFKGYKKNGTSYLLGNRSTLQRHSMLRFPISVSAILCMELREFKKPFGRNKECTFHSEKGDN